MKADVKMPQKLKFKRPARKDLVVTGLVVAGLLVLAQAVYDIYSYSRMKHFSGDTAIIQLIINAVDDLQRPAVVDGRTGQVYLPDAKIVLPASNGGVRDLRYNYDDFAKPAELHVTTNGILHGAEAKLWVAQAAKPDDPSAVFEKVPNLQACARGVLASFGQTEDTNHLSPAGHAKLADGRIMYFYTEDKCQTDLKPLVTYLKKAESY